MTGVSTDRTPAVQARAEPVQSQQTRLDRLRSFGGRRADAPPGPGAARSGSPGPEQPSDLEAGPQPIGVMPGRWRYGWILSAIWLIYLQDTLTQSWRAHDPVLRVVGVTATIGFSINYIWAWAVVRRYRHEQRRMDTAMRLRIFLVGTALFALAIPAAGQSALAMTVFLAVLIMFILPLRVAIALVAVLIIGIEVSSRLVPGWKPVDQLRLSVFVAALAMWGIGQMLMRNAELAAAQRQLAGWLSPRSGPGSPGTCTISSVIA